MKNKTQVAIIGYGEIGQAIDLLIDPKKAIVRSWDKDRSKKASEKKIDDAVKNADVVFFAIPSWHLREAVINAAPYISNKALLVGISKGIEKKGMFATEVLMDEAPGRRASFLAGPMLAEEIEAGQPAGAMVGTRSDAVYKEVRDIFSTRLVTQRYNDLKSLQLCGTLKNVYSLLIGMYSAAGFENNTMGILVPRLMTEMRAICRDLGVSAEAALTMAGLGDLVATAFSPHSSNRASGKKLLQGKKVVCESTESMPYLKKIIGKDWQKYTYLRATDSFARNGVTRVKLEQLLLK